jgi:hypothetical protein
VDSPAFSPLEERQIARETSVDIAFMGIEDE